ncbi:hypothetical protein FNO01nite_32740 [Flavobacterium noncentrifugens]|nr:hypothetical protein FNO01nite_32740 [Flavobacterium noncentrifugens]
MLFCLISTAAVAQVAPAIEWQKSLGGTADDQAHFAQQTADGGYIMAGNTTSNDGDVSGNHGNGDAWVVKLNASNEIEWQKTLGGSLYDYAQSMQQTADGGYIVAGYTESHDGDATGNHGGDDAWIVKLDATGTTQWLKLLGGLDSDRAFAIQQTTDGGYVVAGYTYSNEGDVSGNHGSSDSWVVKLTASGTIEWQKTLGGTGPDAAFAIKQTTDGGYIMAGVNNSNNGNVSGNQGFIDFWVVKLNATGAIQWQKSTGGTDSDQAYSIQQTTDGGYIAAGSTYSNNGDVSGNHGNLDLWVVKFDASGTVEWKKTLGGSATEQAYSILQSADGGYIVAGYTNSSDGDVSGNDATFAFDVWVVKLNATGTMEWQKVLGGTNGDLANFIEHTADGGYVLGGYSASNDGDASGNHGDNDFWIVKLGPENLETQNPNRVTNILYPNPTQSILHFTRPLKKISLNNLLGQKVLENAGGEFINVEGLSRGVYVLEAEGFDGKPLSTKIIKE